MWTFPGFKGCSLAREWVSLGSHGVHARPLQYLRQVSQEAGPPVFVQQRGLRAQVEAGERKTSQHRTG